MADTVPHAMKGALKKCFYWKITGYANQTIK